ncbi:hypothetical protein HYQ46_000812 [Verticillium longisporum]|nr:hypothetical protein HYQ46_000812 [Verticillium longisporum]
MNESSVPTNTIKSYPVSAANNVTSHTRLCQVFAHLKRPGSVLAHPVAGHEILPDLVFRQTTVCAAPIGARPALVAQRSARGP